ncbi:WhiB family transcriptional regulator [Streptomyces sp. Ac-502]|uniref:WhiB family transcriptional regulator n=1 Tax=Streptomyces sp. Ac-502 TaxID=3342801 RepID=UPI0038629E9D
MTTITPPHNTRRAAPTATTWHEFKNCGPEDYHLFTSDDPFFHAEAKEICQGCPVVEYCLQFALATKADWGVYGGLGPNERIRLSGRRPRYVHEPEAQWKKAIREHEPALRRLRGQKLTGREIAVQLGLNTQIVNRALRELDTRNALDAASEAVPV